MQLLRLFKNICLREYIYKCEVFGRNQIGLLSKDFLDLDLKTKMQLLIKTTWNRAAVLLMGFGQTVLKEGHQRILRLDISPALDDAREILNREKASQQSRAAGNATWKRVLGGKFGVSALNTRESCSQSQWGSPLKISLPYTAQWSKPSDCLPSQDKQRPGLLMGVPALRAMLLFGNWQPSAWLIGKNLESALLIGKNLA